MSTPADYGGVITEIQLGPKDISYMVDLIQKLPDNALMVEWGSGGSTCKWLDTLSDKQKLVSIEHNETWQLRVTRAIKNHFGELGPDRFEYIYIPEEHGFEHGYGNVIEEHPLGTRQYINPREDIFNADIFFIDGIARAACLMNVLLQRSKKDAAIFIHDYVGREAWYDWAAQFCEVEIVGDTLARLYPKNQL